MPGFRSKLFATKRRKVASFAVLALLITGGAIAALINFTGASGSGTANIAPATLQNAITISTTEPNKQLANSGTTVQSYSAHNDDPAAAHVINTLTPTITTSPSNCASFLSVSGQSNFVGTSIPANGTIGPVAVTWTVSPSLPGSCGSATITLSFTGTTTP
jgi:hypothetical protein